jgi:hypothetical protein
MYNQQPFRETFQHHILLQDAQIDLRLQRATGLDGRLFRFAQQNKQLPAQGDLNSRRSFAGKSRGVCVYVQKYGRLTIAKIAKRKRMFVVEVLPLLISWSGDTFLGSTTPQGSALLQNR